VGKTRKTIDKDEKCISKNHAPTSDTQPKPAVRGGWGGFFFGAGTPPTKKARRVAEVVGKRLPGKKPTKKKKKKKKHWPGTIGFKGARWKGPKKKCHKIWVFASGARGAMGGKKGI